jgi:hypothetical protein
MTFSELVNELEANGFNYVSRNRLEDWTQRGYQQVLAAYPWPFLEMTFKNSVAPFEIGNVRHVLSVTDVTQERPLYGQSRQWIVERFPNLEEQGNPLWWFLDNLTIRTFPLSGDEISVRYVKKAAALTAEAEPLVPNEWCYLIVDLARVFALKDNDEYNVARELKESTKADLLEMVSDQMLRDYQRPRQIVRTGWPTGYL